MQGNKFWQQSKMGRSPKILCDHSYQQKWHSRELAISQMLL